MSVSEGWLLALLKSKCTVTLCLSYTFVFGQALLLEAAESDPSRSGVCAALLLPFSPLLCSKPRPARGSWQQSTGFSQDKTQNLQEDCEICWLIQLLYADVGGPSLSTGLHELSLALHKPKRGVLRRILQMLVVG